MSPEAVLRCARLSSGLSLDDVMRRTRLSPRIARALDEGRFADLPGGLYARSYVRAFAAAVDADPHVVEEHVMPVLPGVEEPVAAVNAALLQPAGDRETDRDGPGRAPIVGAAAFLDALFLLGMNAALLWIVAFACGMTAGELLAGSAMAVAAIGTVATVTYFVLFAGIDGRTPGRALCRLPRLDDGGPLGARQILDRAATIGVEEASLLLTWIRRGSRRSA